MNYEAMDAETVAALLGVGDRQLRNYCKQGLPFDQRGRERIFAWPRVLEWYLGFKSGSVLVEADDDQGEDDAPAPGKKENLAQATLRKTRAEADLKTLTLSRQRGEVIPIGDAKARLDRMLGNLRTQLLNMPPKLATRLAGERDPNLQEGLIKEEMELLCRELATGKVVGSHDEDESSEADQEQAEATEADTVTDLQAAADDIDVDSVVVEFLVAHAAYQEALADA